MRANEIFGQMKWFRSRVRVVLDGFDSVVNTLMTADTRSGVIAILCELYGRKNVLSCNEISGVLSEKSYGAPKTSTLNNESMRAGPNGPEQLQVKAAEKIARDDTARAAQSKAQLAVTKAQQKKNKAQQEYTQKAIALTKVRNSTPRII